ncbi:conserved hypothetical protein [Streptomyces sviceus ATCC 29083]|uniref:Alpha-L-rhamnosidase C-terminal domain-containing protein n=1 Tax=Streptomyces sviceus (strain ATCC 29083 / DSM 924 / JCM 4929 / NBRC 13980 / NCIMB 11184 / NRRL 5439 / UC 5370) TaxID=463191 RepID=B5HVZ3_STRX2|nr:conserved hypothetical protein [Streptomyces sviceus ATCC 29083]
MPRVMLTRSDRDVRRCPLLAQPGRRPHRDLRGFQHFVLQPHIDPTARITQVSGSHESPYGEIRSEWKMEDGGGSLVYDALVPANSEATLRLSVISADAVREGRTPLARVDGVRLLGHKDGVASYKLPSGRYHLTARLR